MSGTASGPSGQAVVEVLDKVVRLVRGMATAGDLGVSAAAVLARVVREGPTRLTDLAEREGSSQPGMTQLVTRLERDGLVRRGPSDTDLRVVLVAATDEGERLVARRRAERADVVQGLLDGLDPRERTAIAAALPALGRLVDLGLATSTTSAAPVAAGRSTR